MLGLCNLCLTQLRLLKSSTYLYPSEDRKMNWSGTMKMMVLTLFAMHITPFFMTKQVKNLAHYCTLSEIVEEVVECTSLPYVQEFSMENILLTRVNLLKKGINLDTSCPLCRAAPETSQRLFMQCKYSKLVCFSLSLGFRIPENSDLNDWLLLCLSCDNLLKSQLMCTTLWKLGVREISATFSRRSKTRRHWQLRLWRVSKNLTKKLPRRRCKGIEPWEGLWSLWRGVCLWFRSMLVALGMEALWHLDVL